MLDSGDAEGLHSAESAISSCSISKDCSAEYRPAAGKIITMLSRNGAAAKERATGATIRSDNCRPGSCRRATEAGTTDGKISKSILTWCLNSKGCTCSTAKTRLPTRYKVL